jgi:hypothetical protein
MNQFETFKEFLTTQSVQVPIWGFVINLFLTALLAYILSVVYSKYGKALSNRKSFSGNFILLAMTTMLIISVVKSSLALSLGLVGALSIVRFRAAIKEPEELAYLFLCISIGLGLGADQTVLTLVALSIIILVIIFRSYSHKHFDGQNFVISISSDHPDKKELEYIISILKDNCSSVNMKRIDETKESLEASFLVEFKDVDQFMKCKESLQASKESLKITFMDNAGLI